MNLATETLNGVTLITIPGTALDASNVTQFRAAATPLLVGKCLVLDVSALQFIDSSGLGALLACMRLVVQGGGELKFCGPNKAVRTLFELVRLHRIADIHPTRAAAIAAFGPPPAE